MSIIDSGQCGHNLANVDTMWTYSGQSGHNVDIMWTSGQKCGQNKAQTNAITRIQRTIFFSNI